MSHVAACLLISLVSTLAVACTDDEILVPASEDKLDTLCPEEPTSVLLTTSEAPVEYEFPVGNYGAPQVARFDGTLNYISATDNEMHVDTQELIFNIPGSHLVTIEAGEGRTDLFTTMTFAVDFREPGTTAWQSIFLPAIQYDVWWFTNMELSGVDVNPDSEPGIGDNWYSENTMSFDTLTLCEAKNWSLTSYGLPFDATKDYEMRIRVFPFKGFGSLEGVYDYNLVVTSTKW